MIPFLNKCDIISFNINFARHVVPGLLLKLMQKCPINIHHFCTDVVAIEMLLNGFSSGKAHGFKDFTIGQYFREFIGKG